MTINNGRGVSPGQAMVNSGVQRPHQDVVFGSEAHDELLKGATILANAVRSTMGPSGHNVIIDNDIGPPSITKDGVTVARSINLKDRLQSMGAELLKEIASKTNELAGDGTTTATVLGHALLEEGIKMVATKRSSIYLKKGMDIATDLVIKNLKNSCIPVSGKEDIVNVGTISANGDRIVGELLAEAISKVGQDGIITIEQGKSTQTTLDVVEGMQIDGGYVSPYFVNNPEKVTCEFDDPYILLTSRKISSLKEILGLLEAVAKNKRPLLIVADDVDGEALHTLIVNKFKGIISSCVIKAPSYGDNRTEILSDIAAVTNGQVIDASSASALEKVTLDQLGSCKRVIVSRTGTTIVGSAQSGNARVEQRVNSLKTALATDTTLDDLRVNHYRKRLAKLSGGVAVIKVGGSTEVEILEKKDRVEDALNATLAAAQEGIVAGGGCALFYAALETKKQLKADTTLELSEDEWAGVQVVLDACNQPLQTIVQNTGKSADVVMYKLQQIVSAPSDTPNQFRYGYDARMGVYGDLVEKGIIDPVKVTRYALEHASSVVGLMLTANCVVLNEKE
jgi:chaperonin GroEL